MLYTHYRHRSRISVSFTHDTRTDFACPRSSRSRHTSVSAATTVVATDALDTHGTERSITRIPYSTDEESDRHVVTGDEARCSGSKKESRSDDPGQSGHFSSSINSTGFLSFAHFNAASIASRAIPDVNIATSISISVVRGTLYSREYLHPPGQRYFPIASTSFATLATFLSGGIRAERVSD